MEGNHSIKKPEELKLRFSNYWLILFLSLIPWLVTYLLLRDKSQTSGYDLVKNINEKLPNFVWILLSGLFFTSMGMTSTSFYASNFCRSLDKLSPLIDTSNERINEEYENDKEKINKGPKNPSKSPWYEAFVDEVNSLRWVVIVLPVIALISVLHYFIYGSLVVDAFGWNFYIITLIVLVWNNTFIITWVMWFVLAQYFHIYKFTKPDLKDGTNNEKQEYVKNESNEGMSDLVIGLPKSNYKLINNFLPRKTSPKKIRIDIFNVDGLGGLSPLAQLSLSGTVLTGIVIAVLVPALVVANPLAAVVIIPISFIAIIAGYVIGIASLRDAIRAEKISKLSLINTQLRELAHKIMTFSINSQMEGDIEKLKNINDQFTILESLGERINNIPEGPTSLKAFVRIGSSSVLPLLSFISIDQLSIFF